MPSSSLPFSLKERYAEHQRLFYTLVSIVTIVIFFITVMYYIWVGHDLRTQSDELDQVRYYDLSRLDRHDMLKDNKSLRQTVEDMFAYNDQLRQKVSSYTRYREELSLPYTHFLHYIYTPSLNIWKNPFTQEIDTTLIGEKYLAKNPYNDIALIQRWTDFFKDMGTIDQYNTITNISIGTVTTQSGGFFGIPLTVQFETPDRRSFLLLVNKLSMTSYADNVSLISEFMYNLWTTIRTDKKDAIQTELSGLQLSGVQTEDALIGYRLYQRIYADAPISSLIDTSIVNKAIAQTAGCTDQSSEQCLYMFRDKYRTIPYLAYGVARPGVDTVLGLREFLRELPPLIGIDSFSFDRKGKKVLGRAYDNGYKGSISITIYGRDVAPEEMQEIALLLGKKCFRDGGAMSVDRGAQRVEQLIEQLGGEDINIARSTSLQDMKKYFTDMTKSYDSLPYYKKVIRLFEVYRTLLEGNACDIIINTDSQNTSLEGSENLLPVPTNSLLPETFTGSLMPDSLL